MGLTVSKLKKLYSEVVRIIELDCHRLENRWGASLKKAYYSDSTRSLEDLAADKSHASASDKLLLLRQLLLDMKNTMGLYVDQKKDSPRVDQAFRDMHQALNIVNGPNSMLKKRRFFFASTAAKRVGECQALFQEALEVSHSKGFDREPSLMTVSSGSTSPFWDKNERAMSVGSCDMGSVVY